MKIKIRPDDASMLELNDWLAELREDGRANAPSDEPAEPLGDDRPGPVSDARPEATAEPHHEPAEPGARPTVRAVIGDQLRMPVMWCEMGSCISRYADPAALGEGDMRARAIGAGWRIDALGRLACPRCQQADPNFRACHQVVPWDRYTAMARTARIVSGPGRGELMAITRWHPGAGESGH